MTHDELNIMRLSPVISEYNNFLIELNNIYDRFSSDIGKKRISGHARVYIEEITYLAYYNMEYVLKMPKEDLYMVLNCVKLAKMNGFFLAQKLYNMEEYQKLEESYKNLR